ncbi:heterocyst differentiation protein HetZ [Microcoleus sp. PH2017_28_MFU_U_A]|uniref:heterocyst differentiation protein HetZ n=1 Tax=Microcoleus sp. PH2017_28_MFU_U_A TaxID=2798838 RepID=UPI001D385B2D|nr:heterocyst differentiation protein HetZ [Microcoleus sp. PH2017_28_MFU_U_A]MCC3595140.1 heterocyst differentiation protein HetZ [Microcoleus sp. PH2017_28_MFU_U_A]
MREICQSVETIFQLLLDELKKSTRASEQNCQDVAGRLAAEVNRICTESQRIQNSGDIEGSAQSIAQHRLQQCLHYYTLGSGPGRVELHSTLSAIVYRYITPPQVQSSYQARVELIKDFLQGFYLEALKAFRRETELPPTYSPRTRLELAEYMAFVERFGKRRIPLPRNRSQQLIILRAQTFSQQQPKETSVDMEQAADGGASDSDQTWNDTSVHSVREAMAGQGSSAIRPQGEESESLRQNVIDELVAYLKERNQQECADYFILRLQDLPTNEIESLLNITPRQRDYLQQRFKYHLLRFAMSHRWELVHQWLEADLDKNLGLLPSQWQIFGDQIGPEGQRLLKLKQQGLSESAIAQTLGSTVAQVQKRWFKLLELAWELRNRSDSGEGASSDE